VRGRLSCRSQTEKQTKGFRGSEYKGFKSEGEAWAYFKQQKGIIPPENLEQQELQFQGARNRLVQQQQSLSSSLRQDALQEAAFEGPATYVGMQGGNRTMLESGSTILESAGSYDDSALRRQLQIPPDAEIIYTDGACSSNGKGFSSAGIGVFYGINDPRNVSLRLPGLHQTNQRAELHAVLIALERYPLPNTSPNISQNPSFPTAATPRKTLVIITDSKYVIQALTTWITTWEKNNYLNSQNHPVISKDLFIRARRRIKELHDQGVDVEFRHVLGHQGVWGNEMADRLAVRGAGMGHFVDESMEVGWEDEELDRAIAEGDIGV